MMSSDKHGVAVMVAIPDVASHAPDPSFDVEHFNYDKASDCYTCPANELLTTNGKWYNKSRGKSSNKIKQYTSKVCKGCQLMSNCTANKAGRMLERSEHADLIFENKQRIEQNKQLYRTRQAIVEHPYGIIKRQWGFYYISTKKGIKHAAADVGLIFVAYNLRRIFNLIDKNTLKKFFQKLGSLFLKLLALIKLFKPCLKQAVFYNPFVNIFNNIRLIAPFD